MASSSENRGVKVVLGSVAGAHGVKGALKVHLDHAGGGTFRPGIVVTLRAEGSTTGTDHEVIRVAPKPGSDLVRVWLEGIGDRNTAEARRGQKVEVARSDLPDLDDDEYYLADLVGHLVTTKAGRALGRVCGVTTNTVQDLLVVAESESKSGEWLLPVLPEFVVEIDDGTIVVDLPPGFLPTSLETEP